MEEAEEEAVERKEVRAAGKNDTIWGSRHPRSCRSNRDREEEQTPVEEREGEGAAEHREVEGEVEREVERGGERWRGRWRERWRESRRRWK